MNPLIFFWRNVFEFFFLFLIFIYVGYGSKTRKNLEVALIILAACTMYLVCEFPLVYLYSAMFRKFFYSLHFPILPYSK